MTAVPSVSYSITVRRQLAVGGPAVSQLATAAAFPGVFRGLLDAHCAKVRSSMLLAAARALAGVVSDDERNAAYIMPSVFHADVRHAVATAVREAARGPTELPTDTEDFL